MTSEFQAWVLEQCKLAGCEHMPDHVLPAFEADDPDLLPLRIKRGKTFDQSDPRWKFKGLMHARQRKIDEIKQAQDEYFIGPRGGRYRMSATGRTRVYF
jgi:hypothetical protein